MAPIAVVGVGSLFPGSDGNLGFWRDIVAGRDQIRDVPPTHWLKEDYLDPQPGEADRVYCARGAFLSPVAFDPLEFVVPPSAIPSTDTSQLLALLVARRVLEPLVRDRDGAVSRERVSVILGVASATELVVEMGGRMQRPVWVKAMREAGLAEEHVQEICERIAASYVPWTETTFPGMLGNVVAGRIANRLDLGGTNCVLDAACASSLAALDMGVMHLLLGRSDLVLTGGVDTLSDVLMFMAFSKTGALSRTGDARPFSDRADGTVLGEGVGMVALKRLADAERDGDPIHAVIRGVGASSDGHAKSVYAPRAEGQARALRRAYDTAGYTPADVELVEAHGTGTTAGDAAELEALATVFRDADGHRRQWCAIGSIKSQIGHAKAAAGAAGLIKAVMALHHAVLPPTIKVEAPNPQLDLAASPFYVNTRARPWIHAAGSPRRASVSSFGFGGSNFHVTLEEYRGPGGQPSRLWAASQLFLLGADDESDLAAACRELAARCEGAGGGIPSREAAIGRFLAAARQTQTGFRTEAACRLALVASDADDLVAKLHLAAAKVSDGAPDGPLGAGIFYASSPASPGKVALLFPGQGSQFVGMGADLAMAFEPARAIWDQAAGLDLDPEAVLHEVVFPPPAFSEDKRRAQAERLTRTEWAQPAIGAASLAALSVLRVAGLDADCLAGHSFGELSALCAAGSMEPAELLRLARLRGEAMGHASGTAGAMTSAACGTDRLRALLVEAGPGLAVANVNAPQQVVVSGPAVEIERFERLLAASGVGSVRLPVATAFHSPLMRPAADAFGAHLAAADLRPPRVTVFSCRDGRPHSGSVGDLRHGLAEQIAEPVDFTAQVEAMYAHGVRTFVEVGPGGVLTRLVAQCLNGRPHLAVSADQRGQDGVAALWYALGRLAVSGVPLRLAALWPAGDEEVHDAGRPGMSLAIGGANYGRPYPPAGGAPALPPPNVRAVRPDEPPAAPPAREPASPWPAAAAPAPAVREPSSPWPAAVAPAPAAQEPRSPWPAAAPPAAAASGHLLSAFQEMSRQAADSQSAFESTLAQSHDLFLKAAAASLQTLTAVLGAAPERLGAWQATDAATPGAVGTELLPAPPDFPRPDLALPGLAPVAPPELAPDGSVRPEPAPATVDSRPAGAQPAPGPAVRRETLLAVVAEKTGYPADMLGLDLDLEAELGIDSIKRVEILAAVQQRLPGLPAVQPAELAQLSTLGKILDFMEAAFGGAGKPTAAPEPVAVPAPAAPQPVPGPAARRETLLAVVAEKTGYPADMLGLDLDLEAELGIDSIKRVEILAAVQQRLPGLPAVQPAELALLNTLGKILDFMEAAFSGTGEPTAAPEPIAVPAPAAPVSAPAAPVSAPAAPVATLAAPVSAPAAPVATLAAPVSSPGAPVATLADPVSAPAFPLSAPAPEAVLAEPASVRYTVEAVAADPAGFALPGLRAAGMRLAITDDGGGVAPALADRLRAEGIPADVVREVAPDAPGVVLLEGLRPCAGPPDGERICREAFLAARSVAARMTSVGGVFVTVQDTGGDLGLSGRAGESAWLAGLAALAKTAGREWPLASVKAIDVERGGLSAADVADRIAEELLAGGPEEEVGRVADGTRVTPVLRPVDARPGSTTLPPGAVVVASGGARGVTAACLRALAAAVRPRLAILGRTLPADEPDELADIDDESGLIRALRAAAQRRGASPSPGALKREAAGILASREVRANLRALRDAGAEVRYLAADVRDEVAVAAAVEGVRAAWGPIEALIHGAGVIADRPIAEKTPEQFDRVFSTKTAGLRALLAATRDDPLRLLCLFSSVAARSGNAGQADYAMGNEVLNRVASAEADRRGGACRVRSIGWGPWAGGMVTPALQHHFESRGIPLLALDEGCRRFVEEVARDGAPEVVIGAAPLYGAEERTWTMEVAVGADTHPYLADHRVRDIPVVPVVQVLEWFVRAAAACRPDLPLAAVEGLSVLRGVRLERYGSEPTRLMVRSRGAAGGPSARLRLELLDADGRPRYGAAALMGSRQSWGLAGAGDGGGPAGEPAGEPWPWTAGEVYDGKLFHGPSFRVIRDLVAVSPAGGTALLDGVRRMGWRDGVWRTDPALLDGGLQVARLWGLWRLGAPTLPTSVGTYVPWCTTWPEQPVRCVLRSRTVGEHQTRSDLAFLAGDGALVAEMRDVEQTRVPEPGKTEGLR